MELPATLTVNGRPYAVTKLLGHGKGGYSYLAHPGDDPSVHVTLKQIHHEPCPYYSFGDKIQAEIHDYERLRAIGIRIPAMLDVDVEQERVVKEYVDGPTILDLVLADRMRPEYLEQARQMASALKDAGLNFDYFPTNFIVQDDLIYYIDFECNDYMDEWNLDNWGVKYWSKTPELMDWVREHQDR